ncbi:MAG: ATP synthase subunit I [Polyangiales bacterium]
MSDSEADDGANDGAVARVGRATLGFASGFAAIAFFASGARFALSVIAGGAIIALNLFALSTILRRTLVAPSSAPASPLWALAFLAKLVALFGGTYALFASELVTVLGVAVGFASLLPAIVLEGARASDGDRSKPQ